MVMLAEMIHVVMIVIVHSFTEERQAQNKTCDICDCSVKYVVNCSNKSLHYIPGDIDNYTEILDLSSNYLQHIDAGNFENLKKLIRLNLSNTALKKDNVSTNAFQGLANLKVLDISLNDQFPLTNSTQSELFEHLKSLEILRMHGTTGTYNVKYGYPDLQLSTMAYLKEVWMDGFTISPFGSAFRNMTNLKVLHLPGDSIEPSWRSKEFCMIEKLENGMLDNLVTITHLYMRKCSVKTIDKDVFKYMENLEYLDMSLNNRLGFEQLFKSFCSLPVNTTRLILNKVAARSPKMCGNFITETMVKCIKDKQIKELQLNHNVIYYIEAGVFSTFPDTLEVISVRKNEFHLGLYMFYIFYMANLKKLDVSYQYFTDATSIWHNRNEDSVTENTHCTKIGESRYKQSNTILQATRNNNLDEEVLNQYDNVKYADDVNIGRINALQPISNRDSVSISIIDVKNEDSEHQMTRINSRNTEKVCPSLNKDNYIPPGTVLINIPPRMEYLDLSHSKLANPIFEMYVNETNDLKIINASNSLLYCWDGPVHGLTKLEILDLSNNFCTNISKRFFETLTNLTRLNISFNFLGTVITKDVQGQLLANLTKLRIIDFSFNLIQNIPLSFFKSQMELEYLIGHVNMMEEFNVNIRHMTKLRTLDLKANKLRKLSIEMRKDLEMISTYGGRSNGGTSNIKLHVDLRANPLECSCDNVGFIKWLHTYYESNSSLSVNVSHCLNEENHHVRVNIRSQNDLQEMIHYLESQCRSYTSLIVGLSIALAIIINVILGIIVHRFRWKLQYWYYVVLNRKNVRLDGYELIDEPRYKYDVFVASPDDQKEFIIDKLRPVFKRNSLTAFLSVYHINFNDRLVHTIGKAINESKVVLFVFSNEWSTDHCMNIAVHMWQCDMIQRNKRPVLGIYLNNMTGTDAEKVQEIFCSTFIDFPGGADEEEQEAFWIDCVDNIKRHCEVQ